MLSLQYFEIRYSWQCQQENYFVSRNKHYEDIQSRLRPEVGDFTVYHALSKYRQEFENPFFAC